MKWNRNHSLPLSAIVLFFPPLEIDLESRLIGRMTRRGLLKSPPLFGSSVQFYLSLCSLSKIILVWPKGRKVLGSTIQSRGTNRGEPCLDIVRFLMVNTKELFRAYIPDSKSIPFKLGFLDHPGHPVQTNTYKNSLREACWPFPSSQALTRLMSIFRVDATACLTLTKPETLARIGRSWFAPQYLYPGRELPISSIFYLEDPKRIYILVSRMNQN